jgi:hypothetical protein
VASGTAPAAAAAHFSIAAPKDLCKIGGAIFIRGQFETGHG